MKHPIIKIKNLEWFHELDGEEIARFRLLFPNGITLNKHNLKIACVSWCEDSIEEIFYHFLDTKSGTKMNKELKNVNFWATKESEKYSKWNDEGYEAETYYETNQTIDIFYKYVPKLKIK